MNLHRSLALGLAACTAAATFWAMPSAQAAPLGSGEVAVSDPTPGGVGETSVAAAQGHGNLVVWEADRAIGSGTQQGTKAEIWGRYVSATDGTTVGSPVLLASLGASSDATLDAVDPSIVQVNNKDVLVFAGDTISDTVGGPTPTDTTNFQLYGAVIDPAQPLGQVTPTQLTTVGAGNQAYDQRHPDVIVDGSKLRVVWEGDSDTAGNQDGQTEVWSMLVAPDLTGTPLIAKVSIGHAAGTAYDNTRPRVASAGAPAGAQNATVVWEGVGSLDSGTPVRRIWAAHLGATPDTPRLIGSSSTNGALEELTPDIAVDNGGYEAVWSANTSAAGPGSYRIFEDPLGGVDGAPTRTPTALTANNHDTLPSIAVDTSSSGSNQFTVVWARRTTTAGTGHYEISTGRWAPGNPPTQLAANQVSSVDGDVSTDNVESLRPAVVGTQAVYAAWGRDRVNGGPGVAGRMIAPVADLFVTVAAQPTNPSPARAGVNPADPVDLVVTYGNAASSSATIASDRVFLTPPANFAYDPTSPVTFQNVVGPTPVLNSTGFLQISSIAPGQGGQAVFHGTLTSGAEGQNLVATAVTNIGNTGIFDNPSLNDTSSTSLTVDYPPAVQLIARASSTPTNAGSVSWNVTFDQVPSGVGPTDFTTTGTATSLVTGVSCAAKICTVTASVTSDGTVGLRVPASATITDPTGKSLATGNLPFDGPSYTVDTVRPGVTVSSTEQDPTRSNPIHFQVTFSEPVTAPTAGSLTATNGTVSTVSGSGTSFDVSVVPAADGAVTLTVPAGATSDAAGNTNTASTTASRTSDRTRPVLTLTTPTTPQNGSFQVSLDSSEAVTGLDLSDIAVTGGTASALTGSGPWTFIVTPDTEGTVHIAVVADAVSDGAGNTNAAVAQDVTYDVTRPDVTVDSSAANRTGTSPIPFTLTFTEPVTGLTVDDLDIQGGAGSLTGSGASYVVQVTPSSDGDVSVAVPADVAADGAGNTNTAGAKVTRTYDSTGPGATLTTTVSDPTNASTIPVTVTWTEPVNGFTAGDVVVANGTLSDFAGSGTSYTFTVTPSGDGQVKVSIPAGSAQDVAGNDNLAATPLTVSVDTVQPTATLSSSVSGPTNAGAIPVTLTFSEDVTGFGLDDLGLTNATADDLTGSGTTYHVVVHPAAEGDVAVDVTGGAAHDAAGNPTLPGSELDWTYDTTATAVLAYSGASLVNGAVTMDLTLSDDATLVAGDFDTSNATVALSGGPRSYTLTVTPAADGPFTVQLPAGAFTDDAGNDSSASQLQGATYDGTAPTVAALDAPAYANAPYQVDVTFSESIVALDPAAIEVTDGTAGSVTGSGTDWSFTVTPSTDGPVDVSLATAAGYDAAGNASQPSGIAETTYDATAPTVVVDSPTPPVVSTSPIAVSLTFSEDVTGLTTSGLVVTNGTATNLNGAGHSYTLDVVPSAEGTVTVAVAPGAAVDQAGNGSLASNVLSRDFDSTRPTVALTTTVSDPTNAATIPVRVAFSKPVLGFDASDLHAVGGTVSAFTQVDAKTWTFDLTPTGDGVISVTIPENSAASAGGNLTFGGVLSISSDRTAPTLTLSGPAGTTYDGPVIFTLSSSEPLVGLDATDVGVSGTAHPDAATLTAVDASHWTISVTGMTGPGSVRVALPAGVARDGAGNTSAATDATAAWSRQASFRLLQEAARRHGNTISIPTGVAGAGTVTFSATSSNHRLLPASAIRLTGTGEQRRITLAGRPDAAGRSRVVLRADLGGVVQTIRLTFIVGNSGDNHMVGTNGIDVMLGRHAADRMSGKGGNDYLYGGRGDDRVSGGAGNDLVQGGGGHDVLLGGAGRDGFLVFPHDQRPDFNPAQDFLIHLPRSIRHLFAE